MAREREFYKNRGIPCPKDAALGDAANGGPGGDRTVPANDENHPDSTDYHRRDEQVYFFYLYCYNILNFI